jgi:zinc protease
MTSFPDDASRRAWLARAARLGLAGAAGLGAWAGPLNAQAAAASAASALALKPLNFHQRLLPNGLQLLHLGGGGGGSVSVQVWYRVGGQDDPEGRSGFAHLFEHLMFKRTRHLADEQFDRLTEDVGGSNNAFTSEDATGYQNVVPAHHLERLLWAEAERMSGLQVDEANFRSERAVVQEEYRQRVLANPYGLLFNAISPNAFERHPYRRPVIGSIEDLDAATVDDVRRFHADYYRPDNAVLIVTGDYDPARLDAWVDRYFGVLRRPATPIPRHGLSEPVRRASREVKLTGPQVPLPAVLLLWQGPRADAAETPAVQVAQALLSAGESSRLNEALVYRQRIAQSAGFESLLLAEAGALVGYAIAAGETPPQRLVAPLLAEIERLARGPIAPAELDKVKAQLLTAALVNRQTPLGLGTAMGWAVIQKRDPMAVNRELGELQAVTAADVQRVLRRFVLQQPRVTVHYTQAAA